MTDNSNIHAIVTGGASGLGYATAEAVVGRNGRVAILNTHKTAGESATKQLGKNAGSAVKVLADYVRTELS